MSQVSLKTGFLDMAAALFVIGGVISLVVSILAIPIASIYSFTLPDSFSFVFAVVLVVSLICSFGAIHCYTLASRRLLSQAGMRGVIFGAILLTLSLSLVRTFRDSNVNSQLGAVGAILILIAGAISFVLRESVLPRPPVMFHEQPLAQR